MLPYRPFISGLRAISILAVVGFHVGIPGFSGGFVGVDVFFVISGFLIISQVAQSVQTGRFSFLQFYASRARRILPPLLIVIVTAVMLAQYFLVTPDEMNRFGKSVTTSALMVANHQFLYEQGYFDTRSDLKPLLHIWTLSVEEQFYAVVPLLIVFVAWAARRKQVDCRSLWLRAVGAVSLVSVACCIAFTLHTRNIAFFLMPFRGWEFLAGGAIGLAEWKFLKTGSGWPNLIATLGIVALIAAITLFSPGLSYPSAWVLVPVAGAVAVIVAGNAAPDSPIIRALAMPPLLGVGVVSYGWYLWHWPLLAFLRLDEFGNPSLGARVGVVIVALCLAVAMYLLVERPLRRWSLKNFDVHTMRAAVLAGAGAGALLAGVGLLISGAISSSLAQRAGPGLVPPPITSRTGEGDACVVREVLDRDCIASSEGTTFGMLLGDSFAQASYQTLRARAAESGARIVSYWEGGCPPLIPATAEQANWICFKNNRSALDKAAGALGQRLSFAILTANWRGEIELWAQGYYARQNSFLARPINLTDKHFSEFGALLSHAISHLIAMSAGRILLLGPIPEAPKDMPDCLLRADRKKLDWDETCSVGRSDVDLREAATGQMLRGVAREFGSVVRYLDPSSALCDDRFCRSHAAGSALYVDTAHLSQAGVEQLYASYAGDFEWAFTGKR